ncbi:pseudouridine synthase [Cystobasidium minutum MCA 4210]|uniref:pseudouridine synthase n=1 Tax=Cystobasidium minutum MCA 4210 TaxID=1397322 RepID=UPI0034CE0212|eukprot:jgi/Rhomi1/1098/CE1097_480
MQRGLQVLYQDAKQICIVKPVHCAIQGKAYSDLGRNWQQLLKECQVAAKTEKPLHVVHRLDANTSGVLLLAKTPQAARVLSKQFQNNSVKKTYLAIVEAGNTASNWWSDDNEHPVDCYIQYTETGPQICKSNVNGAKAASTVIKTLSSNGRFALLQLKPTTGRKHQLRLLCSQILKAPIVGDYKYNYRDEKVDGHLLHCYELEFQTWQKTGKMERIKVQADLPTSFTAFAEQHNLSLARLQESSNVHKGT